MLASIKRIPLLLIASLIVVSQITLPASATLIYTETTESKPPFGYDTYPYTIRTDPPHAPHDPYTGFASYTSTSTGYTFQLPNPTTNNGAYGTYWPVPTPPEGYSRLRGVKFNNVSWDGPMSNVILAQGILTKETEDLEDGTVEGASTQGLAGKTVGVFFNGSISGSTTMTLDTPKVVTSDDDFIAFIDFEDIPMGQPDGVLYPPSMSMDNLVWLWEGDDIEQVSEQTNAGSEQLPASQNEQPLADTGANPAPLVIAALVVILLTGLSIKRLQKIWTQ